MTPKAMGWVVVAAFLPSVNYEADVSYRLKVAVKVTATPWPLNVRRSTAHTPVPFGGGAQR